VISVSIVLRSAFTALYYKKTELTLGLARDRAATWRLILNLDSSSSIESVTCAATWRKC